MDTTHTSTYRTGTGIIELWRWTFVLASLGMAGCALDRGDTDDASFAANHDVMSEPRLSANALSVNALSVNALSVNALSVNALSVNALSVNALSVNALSVNALSVNALSPLADPGASGVLSRQLLKYTVSCALTPEHSLTVAWTDANGAPQSETYPGSLGLAPSWADGPLDEAGQRWVSACLGARTNRYGVAVALSLRGDTAPLKTLSPSEASAFPRIEGAFWGNVFGPNPYLRTCYNAENAENSRDRMRDCSAGQEGEDDTLIPCADIEIVGSCWSLCNSFNFEGRFYAGCADPNGAPSTPVQMITSSLP